MATKNKGKNETPPASAGNGVRNVNLDFEGPELAALEKEAAALGMKFATLVRGIVRKRYGFPTPVPQEPAS